jgi:hypothetical protein
MPQAVAPAAAILGLLLLLLDLQLILMFVLLIRDGLLQLLPLCRCHARLVGA